MGFQIHDYLEYRKEIMEKAKEKIEKYLNNNMDIIDTNHWNCVIHDYSIIAYWDKEYKFKINCVDGIDDCDWTIECTDLYMETIMEMYDLLQSASYIKMK